jgi:purine-binding chemotaxis protein CheW
LRIADEMRDAFDAAFASAPAGSIGETDDLLLVGAGHAEVALRLREVAGLFVDVPVTPLPGATRGLLGIAGFRGAAVPVYHLGTLIGAASGALARWVALTGGAEAVAFAFERFDGHARVASSAIDSTTDPQGRAREIATLDDRRRPIVGLASVVERLERRGT